MLEARGKQFGVRWLISCLLLLLLVSGLGGCHNLQSHRLRRWNYNDSGSRGDALWSVGDVLAAGRRDAGPAYHPEVPRAIEFTSGAGEMAEEL